MKTTPFEMVFIIRDPLKTNRLLLLLITIIILSACAGPSPAALKAASLPASSGGAAFSALDVPPLDPAQETEIETCEGMQPGENTPALLPAENQIGLTASPKPTAKETVAEYFSVLYRGYTALRDVNITPLLDMQRADNRNLTVWLRLLTMRRTLLKDMGLCFVDTKVYPYEIVYDPMPEDDRLAFWSRRAPIEADAVLHFRIRGTAGVAYPPTFAANAQHTVFLKKTGDGWQIIRHYYPGSVRKFRQSGDLAVPDENAMRQALLKEFADATRPIPPRLTGILYDGRAAAVYALRHTETPNTAFYHIGDWRGNCANFVSQSVSAGFDGKMTRDWFAGSGGGSPAWENVDYFWNWAIGNKSLQASKLAGVLAMDMGDVLLVRTAGVGDPEDYRHSLMLVDTQKLLFAQNSPGCFVYYSDLVNVETRMLSPLSLAA